jgi:FtsZ-binding cell division protein ZapB
MYVTEKYLKMEIKELKEQLHSLANDLGGDIRYLHQEIVQLQETVALLQQEVADGKDI